MRSLFIATGFFLSAVTCFGQSDSMRQAPTTISPIVTPSNSVPLTSPAATSAPQLQPEKKLMPKREKRRLKTVPPSEPNALGVGVTLDKKEEKPVEKQQ